MVDFPAPFAPNNPRISPVFIDNDRRSTAVIPLKVLVRFLMFRAGFGIKIGIFQHFLPPTSRNPLNTACNQGKMGLSSTP